MDYSILGPLQLGPDFDLALPPKEAKLLAALVVRAGRSLSVDTLIEVLWPEGPPATAIASIQVHVSQLRKRIGATRVASEPGNYRLVLDEDTVDAHRFKEAVLAADSAVHNRRYESAALLAQGALSLWRGRPLPELDEWSEAVQLAHEFEELRALATELKAEAELTLGLHHQTAAALAPATQEWPHREQLRRLLALALYRSGRQVEALAELRSLRFCLREQFGVDATAETERLELAILRQDRTLDPPILTASPRLPAPPTPTFGRERDVEAMLTALSAGARLLTLTGPGGVGKTRLAIETARAMVERAGGFAVFVDLSAVLKPEYMVERIADELEPQRRAVGDPGQVVVEHFCGGGLLVLDNLEQILDAGPVVAALLDRQPLLQVIATSRSALKVRMESIYVVCALDVEHTPDRQEPPALSMFRDRADARRGVQDWSAADKHAALDVVTLVDGLPLAIELAAARCRLLGPVALARRLRASMSLLADGPMDLPLRQRSMQQTLEWSVNLLQPDQRRSLGRLGVFCAGFDISGARAVLECDELSSLRAIEALVDSSLLRVDYDGDGDPRFSMLQVIKAHTAGLLSPRELDAARDRHAAWIMDLANLATPWLRSEHAATWIARLNGQREDIGAAVNRLCETGEANEAAVLMCKLRPYWLKTASSPEGSVLTKALLTTQSIAPELRGQLLRLSAGLYERRGDFAKAVDHASQAVDVCRSVGDRTHEAQAYATLASSTLWLGRPLEAEGYWQRSLGLTEDLETRVLLLGNLGLLALDAGNFERALEIYESAIDHLEELGLVDAVSDTLINLAWAHLGLRQLEDARQCLLKHRARVIDDGSPEDVAYHFLGVARLASLAANHAVAVRLARASIVLLSTAGQEFEPYELSVVDAILAEAPRESKPNREQPAAPSRVVLEECRLLSAQVLDGLGPAPQSTPRR